MAETKQDRELSDAAWNARYGYGRGSMDAIMMVSDAWDAADFGSDAYTALMNLYRDMVAVRDAKRDEFVRGFESS